MKRVLRTKHKTNKNLIGVGINNNCLKTVQMVSSKRTIGHPN